MKNLELGQLVRFRENGEKKLASIARIWDAKSGICNLVVFGTEPGQENRMVTSVGYSEENKNNTFYVDESLNPTPTTVGEALEVKEAPPSVPSVATQEKVTKKTKSSK